ncbi:hypothetical protein UlMin_006749 [Ulmus minor]
MLLLALESPSSPSVSILLVFSLALSSKNKTLQCGHYKKLAPEYEKLGASFKITKSILIGKHKDVCSKYGISSYPTIQWFPKGSLEPKMYEGARTAEALAEYVNKERGTNVKIVVAPSSVVVLSTNNFDEIVLNNILHLLMLYSQRGTIFLWLLCLRFIFQSLKLFPNLI